MNILKHKISRILTIVIGLLMLCFYGTSQTVSTNRFKRIDYDYDLISGKVNDIHYQAESVDAFHHHYEYDADNRIAQVYTSKQPNAVWTSTQSNGYWDNDANYFYYPHGPLARVELGQNKIQGIDYAYTLQGWIKGVNSNTLDASRDIGKDGLEVANGGGTNAVFAKDAFAYSLGYHDKDYKAIDHLIWNDHSKRFEAYTPGSDVEAYRKNLYNGNISHMVTTIVKPTMPSADSINYTPLPQATAYKYDQLNRLSEMTAWQNIDTDSNKWNSGLMYAGKYYNKFTYDGNGNILTATAKNQAGQIIDNQDYHHQIDANGNRLRNRVYAITDSASLTSGNDLLNQLAFTNNTLTINTNNNYSFTEIGERKSNKQDSIIEMKWTIYGKIKEIVRTVGSSKHNLRYDYDPSGNRVAKHSYTSNNVWIKSEFYVRDAAGNIMSTYEKKNIVVPGHCAGGPCYGLSFAQTERHIYGSSNIGIQNEHKELIGAYLNTTSNVNIIGNKLYTGSNHLSNTLVSFTDNKIPIDANHDNIIDNYLPEVISSNDYAPFGGLLTERTYNKGAFPTSFNGKRDDNESNLQDYGMRLYNPQERIFPSTDPLIVNEQKYPELTPFQFASNNPVQNIDLDGLEGEDSKSPKVIDETIIQKVDEKQVLPKQEESPILKDKNELKNENFFDENKMKKDIEEINGMDSDIEDGLNNMEKALKILTDPDFLKNPNENINKLKNLDIKTIKPEPVILKEIIEVDVDLKEITFPEPKQNTNESTPEYLP